MNQEAVLEALKWLLSVTPEQFELYGGIVMPLVASGISAFFMFMKRLFTVNRPAFMFFSVTLVSVTAGCVLYIANIVNGNPMVAALLYPLLTLLSYHFVLKPLTKRYAPKLHTFITNAKFAKLQRLQKVDEEIPGRRPTNEFTS